MTDPMDPAAPVPLHVPALLQNPGGSTLRRVAAHNAQQRERLAAKRESRSGTAFGSVDRRGRRVVRRKDNAAFTSNPHIVLPTRSDYTPPIPLHHRTVQPSFPPAVIPRSAPIPPVSTPDKDPFSSDSRHGAFSTSLKGIRALLRKRGKRAESMVKIVEDQIRGWLDGQGWALAASGDDSSWTVLGSALVDVDTDVAENVYDSESVPSTLPPSSRRMPAHHQMRDSLPIMPVTDGKVPAILELSRSPAHLSWTMTDGFDRLVVHLVARYYDLVSWSENHTTSSGQAVRLTHIILPSLAKPKPPPSSHALLTPETSDLSAPSSSDRDTDGDTESDAGTEMGCSLEPQVQPQPPANVAHGGSVTATLDDAKANLDLHPLHRTTSNTSSMYASSEGGSDFGMMGESLTIPPPPRHGGWTAVVDTDSEASDDHPPSLDFGRAHLASMAKLSAQGWEERPTFFEYLYGA